MKIYVANTTESIIEPFMHQMLISFIAAFLVSGLLSSNTNDKKVFAIKSKDFETSKIFNVGSSFIVVAIIAIYLFFDGSFV